jgi:hypothetical protein
VIGFITDSLSIKQVLEPHWVVVRRTREAPARASRAASRSRG